MLDEWDFQDEGKNSKEGLINRQKSALNVNLINIDALIKVAIFFDEEKNCAYKTSLKYCDCKDFSFSGNSRRKTFSPCKHIYRLAMELNLLSPKYTDFKMRKSQENLKRKEEERVLQSLPRNSFEWGGWNQDIHRNNDQMSRQESAFRIKYNETDSIVKIKDKWQVHGYHVDLSHCECPDFSERRLPCKHIYSLALHEGIALPFTLEMFNVVRAKDNPIQPGPRLIG